MANSKVVVIAKDMELLKSIAFAFHEIMGDERIPLEIRDEYVRKYSPLIGIEYKK